MITEVEFWPTHQVSITLTDDNADNNLIFGNLEDSLVMELMPFHKGDNGDVIDSGIATSLQQQISSNQQQIDNINSIPSIALRFTNARNL